MRHRSPGTPGSSRGLGGWSGYTFFGYRPPEPKTMHLGMIIVEQNLHRVAPGDSFRGYVTPVVGQALGHARNLHRSACLDGDCFAALAMTAMDARRPA
jgi:hypothetical protein